MGMTIEEFEEYAKSHNILTMTKDFYENRLKADLVAMLEEIQLEIEELEKPLCHSATYAKGCVDKGRIEGLIQQKINSLKENEHDAIKM